MAEWNVNKPADGDPIRFVDEDLRTTKRFLEDYLSQSGHIFPGTYGSTAGKHIPGEVEVVAFTSDISSENIDDKTLWYDTSEGALYTKFDGILTRIGRSSTLPSGTRTVFIQDVAPTGWHIVSTVDDGLLYLSTSGGYLHSSGSWTITGVSVADHSHTVSVPSHKHVIPLTISGGPYVFWGGAPWGKGSTFTAPRYSGPRSGTSTASAVNTSPPYGTIVVNTSTSSASVSHNGSWRPAYLAGIICEKD